MNVVPIDKAKVKFLLDEKGVVCIVGTYGGGKSLVVDWIVKEQERIGNIVVRVSYKDLPVPSMDDIPLVAGYSSYTQLHIAWRKLAESARPGGKKLVLILEEVQQLHPHGETFWQIIESLSYYQRDGLRIVMTSQPSILDVTNIHLRNLIRDSIVYPRPLKKNEINEIVEGSPYLSAIVRLSHGHYGTVKYITKLIELNKFRGKKLTEIQVGKWAREMEMVEQFADIIWNGLSASQQRVIRQFVNQRGRIDEKQKAVRELIKSGMLWCGGRRLHLYADWLTTFMRAYVDRLPVEKDVKIEELGEWGTLERKLLTLLISNPNRTISYADLADHIWGQESERYSLWSIARLVSRVRSKLDILGYAGVILTERSVGYRWVQ